MIAAISSPDTPFAGVATGEAQAAIDEGLLLAMGLTGA